MANRTVKDAVTVKGTNPQYLVEKIIRSRIYDSRYWKEECFALTAELLVDKAMKLKYVGGIYGSNIKPTPFLCLVLKMLQIQPEKDIIIEFIKNEDYKYVRALGAYYLRLTGTSLDCYNYVEPLLNDYRKLRVQNRQGGYELSYMDEFVDRLLREERMCDVILPRIQRRQVHEESGDMEPRVSALEDDLEELAEDSGDDDPPMATPPRSAPPAVEASSRHSRREHGSSNHYSSRDHHHHRRSPERQREHKRRSRSRSRERDRRDRHRPEKRHRDKEHKERDHHHRHKERKKHRESGTDDRREINEANALRAKLGLPPLRP